MIVLKLTCGACPEQYSAFLDGKLVGYLRLRHGEFRVDYPDCGGETIYRASPDGDGGFDDGERDYYLRFAVAAILERIEHGSVASFRPPAPNVEYRIVDRGEDV